MVKRIDPKQQVVLARDLAVSPEIFTLATAICGIRGSGKTNDGVVLAERAVQFHVPVVVIDPTSVWWGLKSSADGRSPGLPFYVFGGAHGDVPLAPEAGAVLARFVVENQVPTILDVSDFSKRMQRRFVGEFCEALYDLKNRKRDPLFLVIDEIPRFAPQMIAKGDAYLTTCLGAVEDIVSLGRSRGLGCAFIGQRPATINKNVLTQADNLLAMRTVGAADRKAIDAWVVEAQGDPTLRDEMVRGLATLKQGEGYFWSPAIFETFKRVQFCARETFDSSRTPRVGERLATAKAFATVDLEKLRGEIAETIERVKADDPKALRAEIASLRKQLADAKAAPAAPQTAIEVEKVVEIPVVSEAEIAAVSAAIDKLSRLPSEIANAIVTAASEALEAGLLASSIKTSAATLAASLERAKGLQYASQTAQRGVPKRVGASATSADRYTPRDRRVAAAQAEVALRSTVATDASFALGKGERATMIAVSQYPQGVARDTLSVLTGYKRSSRDAYVQRLKAAGYVAVEGSLIVPTDAGIAALGTDYEPLPTGDALREYWLQRLPEGERAVLSVLVDSFPHVVARSDIDDVTGYKRSSRDAYIQRLKARRLVDVRQDGVRASATLFAHASHR